MAGIVVQVHDGGVPHIASLCSERSETYCPTFCLLLPDGERFHNNSKASGHSNVRNPLLTLRISIRSDSNCKQPIRSSVKGSFRSGQPPMEEPTGHGQRAHYFRSVADLNAAKTPSIGSPNAATYEITTTVIVATVGVGAVTVAISTVGSGQTKT
jgi:hypothetical protein